MSRMIDKNLLQEWLVTKMEPQAISESLLSQGHDEDFVNACLQAYKKAKNEKKQFAGFVVTGLGALLGFLGCVFSLVNPIPELYNLFLYGFTSLAILLIVGGMYMVFE